MKYKAFVAAFIAPDSNPLFLLVRTLCLLTCNLLFFQFVNIPLAVAAEPVGNALPGNGGYTGLLDMPSARLMPDWNMRIYYTWADPYGTYGVTAGVLPWLEVNGRVTRISGLLTELGSDYGDYKDKAIDVKLKLHDETGTWPALAIGATDIHGTGLFTSGYAVASKLFGPFDFTLGIGQGILAGEETRGWESSGTSFFGGAELRLTDKLSLVRRSTALRGY